MIGVPPSAGFVTKLFLILAALHSTEVFYGYAYVFVAVILFSSLLNIVYFWRVIERMYFVKTEEALNGGVKEGDAPMSMLMPMLLLAALCIVVGMVWLTKIPLPFIADTLSELGLGVLP